MRSHASRTHHLQSAPTHGVERNTTLAAPRRQKAQAAERPGATEPSLWAPKHRGAPSAKGDPTSATRRRPRRMRRCSSAGQPRKALLGTAAGPAEDPPRNRARSERQPLRRESATEERPSATRRRRPYPVGRRQRREPQDVDPTQCRALDHIGLQTRVAPHLLNAMAPRTKIKVAKACRERSMATMESAADGLQAPAAPTIDPKRPSTSVPPPYQEVNASPMVLSAKRVAPLLWDVL